MRLQTLREWLTLALITLLPFHAFLVTVGTRFLEGPGHAPLGVLAIWKEVLLCVILLLAMWEYFTHKRSTLQFDLADVLILSLVVWSLLVSFGIGQRFELIALGFRYDVLPLIAFCMLRRVEWSQRFALLAARCLLFVGGIIALYGFATVFLPLSFFTTLGYSDLHSLYLPDAPLAAFQQIESIGLRRIQSVMSGPNQLGLWLLIPWSVALLSLRRDRRVVWILLGVLAAALLLTFSRAAWIGAGVIFLATLFILCSRRTAVRVVSGLGALGISALVVLALFHPEILSTVALREGSSTNHLRYPLRALQIMVEHPFGKGLGSAGPASNRVSDTCVLLRPQDDPSWAKDRPNLCVFLGDEQVQPLNRACDCPLLTENWYLQIGVETGWMGMGLFLILIVVILKELRKKARTHAAFLIFLGVSIAALFLHAWEDAALAWTAWILAAAALNGSFSAARDLRVSSD